MNKIELVFGDLSLIEIIYYISGGPGLLIVAICSAWYAYKQIESTKKEFFINSKRKSIELAAIECKYFANKIIPSASELIKSLKGVKNICTINDTENGIELTREKNNQPTKEEKEIIKSQIQNITRLFNILDGYALYFTGEIADEKMAFKTTGKAYCGIIEDLLKKVGLLLEVKQESYPHMWNLYLIWRDRIETQLLKIDKQKIDSKLKTKKEITIQSLGTK